MPRLFVLVNVAVAMCSLSAALSGDGSRDGRTGQIERSIANRAGSTVFPRDRSALSSFNRSPSLLFLHLLKHKTQHHKLEKITTTSAPPTTTPGCVCVPFYLCNVNQTVITDGAGVIDVRMRTCPGVLEVCCYLRNVTTVTPTPTPRPTIPTFTIPPFTIPTIRPTNPPTLLPIPTALPTLLPIPTALPTLLPIPTALPTLRPTAPPTLLPIPTALPTLRPTAPPTLLPIPTALPTVPPSLNCICVDASMCAPDGIVTVTGQGVIDPRYGLCAAANQVCCRLLAITVRPSVTSMTLAPIVTLPSGQICFVCGGVVQCVSCGTDSNGGAIDPRLILPPDGSCTPTNLLPGCQVATSITSSLVESLGPLRNSGTPQACYCVKTWQCSEGGVIDPDGLGVIDSRFTSCPSADQVCCRSTGIDLQSLRSYASDTSSSSFGDDFVGEAHDLSSSVRVTCGARDDSYAPPQPFPAGSERTYFAEFPWMVALLIRSASDGPYVFQCGASMINDRAVLTAAHCVAGQTLENLVARFGQWNVGNDTQPLPVQEAGVYAMSVHPSYYSGALFHDVAVLVLDRPVVYSANVLPICLPEQNAAFAAGTRCYGTGWGSDSFGPEGKYQTELRKVSLPIVDRASCQARLRGTKLGQHFQLHGSFICAGGEGSRDTCRGDGGGPLACQTATGQFFQAGIVSWGIGCGASDVPAVYASVSQHRQWIDRQLATYGA